MKGIYSLAIPNAEEASLEDIQDILDRQSWYPGDTEQSAKLLKSVAMGMKWIREGLKKKGILDFNPTLRVFVPQRNGVDPQANFFHQNGDVFVDARTLSQLSLSPSDFVRWKDSDGNAIDMHVMEYMMLGGVEETDHARFDQQHPGHFAKNPSLDPAHVSPAQYDAQDHEFEALEKKIDAAESLRFPEEIVDGLRRQLQAAVEWRAQK